MMRLLLLLSVVVGVVAENEYHEWSIESLIRLIPVEKEVVSYFEWHLKSTDEDASFKEHILKYIEISKIFIEDKDLLLNPINAFHFVKHIAMDFYELVSDNDEKSNELSRHVLKQVIQLRVQANYPDEVNMFDTASAIANLQVVYDLSITKLVQGRLEQKIKGTKRTEYQGVRPFNAWDCNILGTAAMRLVQYKEAGEWFRRAIGLCKQGDTSIQQKTPEKNERNATELQYLNEKPSEKGLLKDFDEVVKLAKNPKNDRAMLKNIVKAYLPMYKLCRGQKLRLELPKQTLYCKYYEKSHPFFRLRRIKLEEISKDPPVVMFHEFMTEKEMRTFIDIASTKLKPSKLANDTHGTYVTSKAKTSKQYDFKRKDDTRIGKQVSRRIAAATGLEVVSKFSSEPYSVENYGVGGAFLPHMDVMHPTRDEDGDLIPRFRNDKIATFQAYLGDDYTGGFTVFPLIGVAVRPERGAAIFWYNSIRSGEIDFQAINSECPVLYGSKWITVKRMWSYGQTLRLKCGLTNLKKYTFP